MGEIPIKVVLMTNFWYVNPSTRMFSHSDSDRRFFSYDPTPRENRPRKNPLSPSFPLPHIDSIITLPHSSGTSSKAERILNYPLSWCAFLLLLQYHLQHPPPKLQQDQILCPSIKTPNLLSPANGVNTGSPISHLSTPLGPPVFTSPVRPAAVPFRTSPTTRILIILYGRTVSVYDFSEEFMASAWWQITNSGVLESVDLRNWHILVPNAWHASSEVAHKIFSSLRPYKLNIPEASKDRCLGTAVEVALAIIQGPSAEMSRGVVKRAGGDSRIIVCAGGPNTYGPGSVPHSFSLHSPLEEWSSSTLKYRERWKRSLH